MKLYDYAPAPSPRRVRMFLAEKGLEIETVQVDLAAGAEFVAPFVHLNPRCVVPLLELDDGTCIGEAAVICRYLEALHPEPPLHGTTPEQRALIEMWDRAMEEDGFRAVAEVVRNTSPAFADRALTGQQCYPQLPELAERGARRTRQFMDDLDARLGVSPFVAGPEFSVADITAFVCVGFARWARVKPESRHTHLLRWHEAIAARPSANA
jgi:glutathione S-transferase